MKVLRARLFELEVDKQKAESQAIEDSKLDIAWGSQIRSYVLQPYRLVKDHGRKSKSVTWIACWMGISRSSSRLTCRLGHSRRSRNECRRVRPSPGVRTTSPKGG